MDNDQMENTSEISSIFTIADLCVNFELIGGDIPRMMVVIGCEKVLNGKKNRIEFFYQWSENGIIAIANPQPPPPPSEGFIITTSTYSRDDKVTFKGVSPCGVKGFVVIGTPCADDASEDLSSG